MKVSTGFCCPHSRTTMGTEHAPHRRRLGRAGVPRGILMCSVLRVQNLLLRLRDWEKKGMESLSRSDMIGQSRLMSTW